MGYHNKNKAFTLAEVLITLGVIGIVAALTLPSLISNHQEKVKITKLKKAYSVLSSAYTMAKAKYDDVDNWTNINLTTFSDANTADSQVLSYDLGSKLAEFINTDKVCSTRKESETCWGKVPYLSFLTGIGHGGGDYYSFRSAGIVYGLQPNVDVDINSYGRKMKDKYYAQIHVGIEPQNKTSVLGKNVFVFLITDTKIIPAGIGNWSDYQRYSPVPFDSYCLDNGSIKQGMGCTAWVLQFENFEYLKGCSNLSWYGEHTCR